MIKIYLLYTIPENITDNFVKQLKYTGAPVQLIVALRKLKKTRPSLKPLDKKELISRLIYKIICRRCTSCQVNQTRKQLITRFNEHMKKKEGAVKSNFRRCVI